MEISRVSIDALIPDPSNARMHDEINIAAIKGSLAKFGQQKPIVITKNNVVVAGNGTLEAAKALGWTDINVVYSDLSGTEAIAFAIADNRTAELGSWNKDILGKQLLGLSREGFGIANIGFDPKQWIRIEHKDEEKVFDESKQDDIPSIETGNTDLRVMLGDIWQLDDHRLMCGDSTDRESVLSLFTDNKAALLFTSPPYSDQRTYRGDKELSTEYISTFISVASDLCELLAVNLGLSRKDGEIIQYWDDYIKKAKDAGLKLLSWNVWDKGAAGSIGNQTAMFAITHEWIFVFGKNRKELNKTYPNKNQGMLANHTSNRQADGIVKKNKERIIAEFSNLRTVYAVTAQKARDDIDHPARFPVEFPQGYIEACTNPGDWVYEPFCGSGTTLIACEKTDRKCLAMELDPHYCDIILKRWETVTGKKAVKL